MRKHARLSIALREPLVQFLLLGAVIFALSLYLGPTRSTPPDNTVVVSAARIQAFRADFVEREARAPTADETQAFINSWVESEVLYRQARALGLDANDRLIHRQLVRKMRYLIEDSNPLPQPTTAELQTWLQSHRQRYGRPPTISFEHVFIGRQHADGPTRARTMLAGLRGNDPPSAGDFGQQGDPFPGGHSVRRATAAAVSNNFGKDFAGAIRDLPQGSWQGPVASRLGFHLVRITGRTPFMPATLASARKQIEIDYREQQRRQANSAAIDKLRARYTVRIERQSG